MQKMQRVPKSNKEKEEKQRKENKVVMSAENLHFISVITVTLLIGDYSM